MRRDKLWTLALAGFTALALSALPGTALADDGDDDGGERDRPQRSETPYRGTIDVRPAAPGETVDRIRGVVFEDRNRDGIMQRRERGIRGVLVSDGLNVVKTDSRGRYSLPRPSASEELAGLAVFVTEPDGYDVPVDETNVPQFYYIHKPAGSPANVRGEPFRYGGLEPTGPLPAAINFPMVKTKKLKRFKIAVSGDTQTYSHVELGYLRDTLVKELAARDDLEAVIIEGDVMGDDLSLFGRFKEVMSLARVP